MDENKTPTPFSGDKDLVSFVIQYAGNNTLPDEYSVKSIEITRGVNQISKAQIVLLDGNPSTQEFSIIQEKKLKPFTTITISLGYHQNNEIVFSGIIIGSEIQFGEGNHPSLKLECLDQAYFLTVNRNSRMHLDKTDSDAIQDIIQEYNNVEIDQIEATDLQHPNLVQYYASDWDFILMRSEANGLVVTNEQNQLSVTRPSYQEDQVVLKASYGADIFSAKLKLDARYQVPSILAKTWDSNAQELVEVESEEPDLNQQSSDDYTGDSLAGEGQIEPKQLLSMSQLDEEDLQIWANAQLIKTRLGRVRGTIRVQGSAELKPNRLIELGGLSDYFNGYAYIAAVHDTLEDGNWISEITIGMDPNWFAEQKQNVIAPPASGVVPSIQGLFIGKVKQLQDDPTGGYRVLVDVPIIQQEGEGIWARLLKGYATSQAGIHFMPEIGDEIILSYLNNDPRFPIIIGALANQQAEPPFPMQDDNNIKAIVSREQLKIKFKEDTREIIMETPSQNKIILSENEDEKGILIQDENQNKVELLESGINISAQGDVVITATGEIIFEATGKLIARSQGDIEEEATNIIQKAQVKCSTQANIIEKNGTGQVKIQGGVTSIN